MTTWGKEEDWYLQKGNVTPEFERPMGIQTVSHTDCVCDADKSFHVFESLFLHLYISNDTISFIALL